MLHQMAPKKKPSNMWFKLAPDAIAKEHKTPEVTFVPRDETIMRWSVLVVNTQQYKLILVHKVGEHNFT